MKIETRIALNTLVTYGRWVASLLFGLFSSRWTLAALGQTDYGLYGVVGSVIAVIAFLNTVLSISVTRFYAVVIGEAGPDATPMSFNPALTGWFNVAVMIHGALAAIIVLVGWSVAEWGVRHVLAIPPDRLSASVCALRVGVLALSLSVATVPFTAMFTAWQRFGELACMELVRSATTMAVAYWLLSAEVDRLMAFACLLAGISCVLSLLQAFRAMCRFKACRFALRQPAVLSRMGKLVTYVGWRVLGIFGWLVQKQGGAFVVNLSFGARANAAYSIAGQFATHASSFAAAFSAALVPALAVETGKQDRATVNALALRSCRYMGLLALFCAVPLLCETEGVLRLWLGTTPSGTAMLAAAFTLALTIDATASGLAAALSATTGIGAWQTFECIALMATCPVAWLCFHNGLALYALGGIFVAVTCITTLGRVWFARRMLGIAARDWAFRVVVPLLAVALCSGGFATCVRRMMEPSFLRLLVVGVVSVTATSLLAWRFALDDQDRRAIWGWGRNRWIKGKWQAKM